ncbi:MAG: glycosyltransferase family 4 protein [Pseudomonadota bacterium]|nr:glycosyltransferase family 4 protein [Pseudomonadota bacterium]
MKLLLINYEYPPVGGGAATATWHMARALVQQGHEVTVVTTRYQNLLGLTEEAGVQVYRCRALRSSENRSSLLEQCSFIIAALWVLPRLLKQYLIENVIVYFSIPCGPLGLWCRLFRGCPYVISLRGGDVPGIEKNIRWLHYLLTPVRRLVLRYSHAVVANSEGLKQQAQRVDPMSVQVIPNGVDTDFFYPQPHDNPVFQFLFVGRFQTQKNLFFLLEQLNQLKQTVILKFCCHLVGDGPLKAELQKQAQQLGLTSILTWHGWLPKEQLRNIYQQSDCILNFSLYEGMPNVLLEAMACGLPVVASRVMGNESVVIEGKTGYLINLQASDNLQTRLQQLLENPQQAKQLGANGRHWVEQSFSWAQVAQSYVHLFNGKQHV